MSSKLESEASQRLRHVEMSFHQAYLKIQDDAIQSDARLAQEQSAAISRVVFVENNSENMFADKSMLIQEQVVMTDVGALARKLRVVPFGHLEAYLSLRVNVLRPRASIIHPRVISSATLVALLPVSRPMEGGPYRALFCRPGCRRQMVVRRTCMRSSLRASRLTSRCH